MKTNTLKPVLAALAVFGINAASAGTVTYRSLILSSDPVVYYEFDESEGTISTNSATTGATYTGTFNLDGGSVTLAQPSFAQGGTSYDFGGGFVGSASALTNSLTEWTVEVWVNYDSAKISQSNFLSNDQGGWNDDVLFGIGAETGNVGVPGGSVGLVQQGSPGVVRDAVASPLAAGEWHHVVVTGSATAGALTLYVDGVALVVNDALTNGVTFNGADGIGSAANLTIGAARPNSADAGYRPYDGLLDEVAIYDTVLDAGTIASHFATGSSVGPVIALEVVITPNIETAGSYDFVWPSQDGKVYDLVSSTDLSTSPDTWAVWDNQAGLMPSGTGSNSLTGISGGDDLKRFFAVVENDE